VRRASDGEVHHRTDLDTATSSSGSPRRRTGCSSCGSSTPPARSRTRGHRIARKEIARYETELRAREIAAAEALAQEEKV
jgi:hypothetical protein